MGSISINIVAHQQRSPPELSLPCWDKFFFFSYLCIFINKWTISLTSVLLHHLKKKKKKHHFIKTFSGGFVESESKIAHLIGVRGAVCSTGIDVN